MRVYRGSDGEYYTDADVLHHLEQEKWEVYDWDDHTGTEVVMTDPEERLVLTPVEESELPDDLALEPLDDQPGWTVVEDPNSH